MDEFGIPDVEKWSVAWPILSFIIFGSWPIIYRFLNFVLELQFPFVENFRRTLAVLYFINGIKGCMNFIFYSFHHKRIPFFIHFVSKKLNFLC